MEKIVLDCIKKEKNTITYCFSYSESLSFLFSGQDFSIHYPVNIENVPDGILAIPFVTNVIQIAWIRDCEVKIFELDEDFYYSVKFFLNGFKDMYPEVEFKGGLQVEKITHYTHGTGGKVGVFFSGGVDATTTLLRHYNENPILISLWGADVDYDNEEGWGIVHEGLMRTANEYNLLLLTIKTAFRKFDNERKLSDKYNDLLGTNWWYGVKHGIGIIGHAAVIAYLYGLDVLYIASSNCITDGPQKCASDPRIDNYIRFCGTRVSHDAYDMNRQDKIRYIVEFKKKNETLPITLHVCWKSFTGENCCLCEKCFRTMVGLWIEGEEPKEYGFKYEDDVFKSIYGLIALRDNQLPTKTWGHMKSRLKENWGTVLLGRKYRYNIMWMKNFNFDNLESNICRKIFRKICGLKRMLIKWFPGVYRVWKKCRN